MDAGPWRCKRDGEAAEIKHCTMALSTPCIARQADAAEGEQGRAGARRRASGARQNLLFTGNHVANYSRGRERGATQPGIRQKARARWGRGVWPGQGRARVGPGKPGAAPSRWAPARSRACARAAETCANVYVAAVLRMCRDARLLEPPRCAWVPVWRGHKRGRAPGRRRWRRAMGQLALWHPVHMRRTGARPGRGRPTDSTTAGRRAAAQRPERATRCTAGARAGAGGLRAPRGRVAGPWRRRRP